MPSIFATPRNRPDVEFIRHTAADVHDHGQTIKAYELDKYADIVIRPNLAAMSGSDFSQRNAAILAGEEAAARIMPELQRKLAATQAAV